MKIFMIVIWSLVTAVGVGAILLALCGFEKPKCVHVYVGVEKEEVYEGSINVNPRTIVCIKCYHTVDQKVKPLPAMPNQGAYRQFLNNIDSLHTNLYRHANP